MLLRGLQAGSRAAACNPATWVVTALAVLGEVGYNYWHLSEQQKWCIKGVWGNQTAFWDEATSNQYLAEAVITPALIDKGVEPDNPHQRIIHLQLTGQATLVTAAVELCAIWKNDVDSKPTDISYLVKNTARIIYPEEAEGSTTIAFAIPWDDKGVNLQMRLLYTPDLVNQPLFNTDKGFYLEVNYKQQTLNDKPIAIGVKAVKEQLDLPYNPIILSAENLA